MDIQKHVRFFINTVVVVALSGFVLSCGGGGDSDSGSTTGVTGTISISTSESSIPADNTSSCTITATIRDGSGNPVRHYTSVTFTTTLGRFRNGSTSYTVQTQPPLDSEGFPNPDASPTGLASVTLIAGLTAGSAKVTVSSNGVTESVYVAIIGTAGNISLFTSPGTMPADGASSSTITAVVTDSTGAGVTPGTSITFRTGLGLFQNGLKTFTTTTPDSSGTVRVSLIAGLVPGNTFVEASVNGVSQAVSFIFTRTDPLRSEISVAADPLRIAADGQSTSIVTATVTSIPGADAAVTNTGSPISGIPVTFYDITDSTTPEPLPTNNTWTGTGSDEFVTPAFYATGAITFTMTYVGAQTSNFAVVLWKTDEDPKTKKFLINTTGPVTEKAVTYTLDNGNYQFQVVADGYWEIKVAGDISAITASDATVLAITETDSNGNARYAYTSSTTPGEVTIKAETGEVSNSQQALSDTVDITQTEGPPSRVDVKATPSSTYANGENEINIEADLYDENGQPVPDGTIASFSATAGTLTATTANTVSGKAFTTLIAPASATNVESTVTATMGTFADATVVTFLGVALTDMQATPPAIFANGTDTSEITVRLRDQDGVAIVGETVTFATNNGTLTALSATTDENGLAKTTIIAPDTVGTGTVTATYGTLTANTDISFEALADGSITLSVSPTSIPADGASSSVVTATIKYSSGAAVPQGTTVTFTTTLGTFSNGLDTYTAVTPDDTGIISVSVIAGTTPGSAMITVSAINISQTVYLGIGGDAVTITLAAEPTSIPADGSSSAIITATLKDGSGAAVTQGTLVTFNTTLGTFSNGTQTVTVGTPDATGAVSVSLISGTTAGAAEVTATSNGVVQTVYVSFGGAVGNISLTADPTSIPADGSSSSNITATLTDNTGAPVTPGTSVTFTTDAGTFAGGVTSIAVSTPDATGIVSVSLISSTTAGSATVTASSGGITQSVTVTFSGSVVGTITVTANPNTLPADGTSTSVIRADVRDAQGNPVPDGESISFVVLTGTGTLDQNTATTVGGFAEVTYTASTTVGTETVRAMSTNNVFGTVDISLTGSVIGSVQVVADPTSISADGISTSEITATVKTPDNQVVSGVEVTFKTSRGAITSPHTTDAAGKAVATLTSDRYNDPSVLVTATCQGIEGTVLVSFTGLSLTAEANPTSVLTGGSSTITATFEDASGNPINGATLTFSTDKGTLNPSTPQQTNASGQATVTLTSSVSGIATVTVTGSGATATVTVNFTRYLFTLSANPTTIRVGENSLITATLLDNGVPRAGETVSFSSSLGTLSNYTGVTGADGKTTTTLTAGAQSGIAVVDGLVTITTDTPPTELSANTQVVITGGTAAKVIFTADPEIIATDTGVATLTANVYDGNDQPVPDQEVYFRINQGPGGGEYLSSSVKITSAFGVATIQLYAGSLPSAFEGVEVEANTQADFGGSFGLATLTIAGPVAHIGVGMNLITVEPQGGDLTVDVTGVATDVSGNPVADGTVVSFSVQAIKFDEDRSNDHVIDCWDDNGNVLDPCPPVGTPGFGFTWFSDDVNQDGEMYGCDGITCQVGPMCTTEDVNHNGILDPGEDKNDNGVIDPIQGCVIDGSVETTDGVARAKLVYPQPQANNITVRVTAEAGGVSNYYDAILLCTQEMVDNGTCGIGY